MSDEDDDYSSSGEDESFDDSSDEEPDLRYEFPEGEKTLWFFPYHDRMQQAFDDLKNGKLPPDGFVFVSWLHFAAAPETRELAFQFLREYFSRYPDRLIELRFYGTDMDGRLVAPFAADDVAALLNLLPNRVKKLEFSSSVSVHGNFEPLIQALHGQKSFRNIFPL
jgi:hypothetical protein